MMVLNKDPSGIKEIPKTRDKTVNSEVQIPVPSDSNATYTLIKLQRIKGNLLVVSKRVGTSGTSFSSREVDCSNSVFRYLGEGDTIREMEDNTLYRFKHNPNKMGLLITGSISAYISTFACSHVK